MKYHEWKAALKAEIEQHTPCDEEFNAFVKARSINGTWQVILRNLEWLKRHNIDPGPIPSSVTHCDRNLNLEGYEHPLPEGFTHCGGWLYLTGYKHPLPKGFTHCGGWIYLQGYKHPLPEGFVKNERDPFTPYKILIASNGEIK